MKYAVIFVLLLLCGCVSGVQLPSDLQGKVALVMGYSTDWVEGDRGGNVYTGMTIDSINGEALSAPLNLYDYQLLPPGEIRVQGHCWWRLRGTLAMEDDLLEPVDYRFVAKSDHVYTLSLQMDDYKAKCQVDVFEQKQ